MADPVTHKGAGILFTTTAGKALFLKRGPGGDCPGMWCFPGGTVEEGETAEQCAVREAKEELGKFPKGELALHTRTLTNLPDGGRVDFTTYHQKVAEEFPPELNGEHVGWAWAPVGEPPEPLHPGCRVALDKFNWDELGVARAMMAGALTSPQKYSNVHLFDMRITGTGVAYRNAKHDEKGKEIAPEEFVYRRPENYLTEDFVQRCNGLQVIMMHPAKSLLNSKEFGARTVGAMMLPYIKGDEVWGIAKIYDDDAVAMLQATQMSTSPGVLLGDSNHKLKTEDGTDLLIEGKPALLDHLAICERGVWDKGGEPSGVRTDNNGVSAMALTVEDKKEVGELVAATFKTMLTDTTFLTAIRNDDAGGSKKLDTMLSTMDAFCGKMDAFGKRMDTFEKKMDADEEAKKVAADKKDSDDKDKDKKDSDEDAEAKAKKDAEEAEAKAKKDAEDKAAEEKGKADATLVAQNEELRNRLAAVERNLPKQLTDEDRHAFATVQARADDVYSAFGKKAGYPLSGEGVIDYRKRLATELKVHSTTWKDVDIIRMDEASFAIAESMILKDAAVAARAPTDLKVGELRAIVRTDSMTGQRITEFAGSASFIAGMKRQPRHVKRIGVQPAV